jgi:heptosyltransferase-3
LPLSGSQTSIKRILLVRTDRLGDVILTLPMLPALRTCFPDAYIAMLLRRYTGEILEGNPYVDELIWYDREHELVPFADMCRTLRERQFDAAIVVYPRIRLAWLMFRSGIPLRVGTGYRYYSFLFNRKVYEHRKNAERHELEYNLNLLKELHCTLPADFTPEFRIEIPAESQARVEHLLRSLGVERNKFAIVHPGSGGSAREWPPEKFGQFAHRLASVSTWKVVVTGSKGEEKKVAHVVHASGGTALPLAGQLSIKELGALMQSAALFVSNSTGPLHLAVAMGTPVVGIYPQHTAMSAKRWGPYTGKKMVLVPDRPTDCNVCLESKTACECMATIEVEQVMQAARLLTERVNEGRGVHAN